jgi:exopolysaccharide biosynthesis polyprenyl glycosylphosphotransferase
VLENLARLPSATRLTDSEFAAGESRSMPRSSARLGQRLKALTGAVDATAAVVALVALGADRGPLGAALVAPLVVGWLLLLRAWGAYRRGLGYPLSAEARAIFLAGVSGGLILLALAPELGHVTDRARLVTLATPIACLALGRIVLRGASAIGRRRGALVRRALLVGHGRDAHELLENLEAWPGVGVEVVAVCADTTSTSVRGIPVLGPSRLCSHVARELGVQTVFLAPAELSPEDCSKAHSELASSDIELILTPNAAHVQAGRLSIRQLGGMAILRFEPPTQRLRETVKRSLDVVAAAVLFAVLALPLCVLAILVRLDAPGPALFRQRRIGKDGRPFTLWKFRTMCTDAEALLAELRTTGGGDCRLFKLKDDPRVTRIGRWLRRASLDELPQLWNVLVGEMSLVGPRPALPEEIAEFDDLTLRRLRVKPGITGLWQVHGRADASFATYRRMDAFYAGNWTLLGDLKILFRTVPAIFRQVGAY